MKNMNCKNISVLKVYPSKTQSEKWEDIHSKVSERSTKSGRRPSEEPHNGVSERSKESRHCELKPYSIDKVSNASLDTLETTSELKNNVDEGSSENEKELLSKRAKIKHYNNLIAVRLADLKTDLEDAYRDTYYCSSKIITNGSKQRTGFCRRRWCINCNRMRTAQLIHKYNLTLKSWENKCFLTLTVKNPKEDKLVETIRTMHKFFTEIKDSERKAKRKLVGIRKLEITYNRSENTYHPHFHFVLKDDASAEFIILKWLKKFNPHLESYIIEKIKDGIDREVKGTKSKRKYVELNEELEKIRKTMLADPQFQDHKKADNDSAIYLFKYFTKLTSNSSKDKTIIIKALDKIFQSVKGLRTFQSFGFVAHSENFALEKTESIEEESDDYSIYDWSKNIVGWIDQETGDVLADYTLSQKDFEMRKQIR